jgi:hypothetical protein
MPDRATIEAATPRCPERALRNGHWVDCCQLLRWNHDYGVWICTQHGRVLSMEMAGQRIRTAA